ncbi:MAG: HAMP domain-containing sensor histidine kinase [Candidatus Wallbacteria bacterium]
MKKEYKLIINLIIVIFMFILFGTIGFGEIEKISDKNSFMEKKCSQSLFFLEAAMKNVIELRELGNFIIELKSQKSIDNNMKQILDTYKVISEEVILFGNHSISIQKEENVKKILYYLSELKKISDELISLKMNRLSSSEDIQEIAKDFQRKGSQLQDSINESLKLEYYNVLENFKNTGFFFETLKYKLFFLFAILTTLSIIITYIILVRFSDKFKKMDLKLTIEKIKNDLISLFNKKYDSAAIEELIYIISQGLGAHAVRLFKKKHDAGLKKVEYEMISTYVTQENEVTENDMQLFHDFKFFLENTNIANEFVLYNIEEMIENFNSAKEPVTVSKENFINYLKRYQVKTFLACPIIREDDFKYIISFYFKENIRQFSEERIRCIVELAGSAGVYLDNRDLINEMTKKNLMLNSQNNELEAYAHTVSHDLKTPLAGLRGFLELSKRELAKIDADMNNKSLWDYLNMEINAAKKMDDLITDILALSQANNAALKIEKINMKEIIDMNLKLQENLIKNKNIKVIVADDIPEIEADLESINRVLSNLISNSVKYIGDSERREISISYAKGNKEHIFIFSDTGIGISKDYHPKIFTPFFRTRELPLCEGTGVGLSIIKKIIEKHMGSISFESVSGEGTTFYIKIPMNIVFNNMNKFKI